mmetsp:Transcript_31184/g.56618  ORF Transcript_31184/g.56618 Transcript_31184/m.56618 type:complete len:145 (-) Transcript_31184:384-818(-)|eukprot:CAMPEP_0175055354 /NCGR_PEP_ID=MMETSP0052_2-20121109/10030_1 /TAXON_ID=51329 ORGANISM="Polytomella parva, Strain SAG 63-3" /NCGR_SAMPLE_ID=MMETSP0052_2 /ASSEMBLY_ACC=CAM_ASM_000194 /LENGTH=144 /DNA_ID=CAMNT_0016320183 /DNA_START=20 /DNA_END=454 /DNA_ORIENTATION=+
MSDRTADFKEAFTLFDVDNDGYISTRELGTVIRALGKSPTEAEIRAIIQEIDPQNRGFIDYKEFEEIMFMDMRTYNNEQELTTAWRVFDKQATGVISTVELKHILSSVGEKLSPKELNDLLLEADPESKGTITYQNFMKLMLCR